MLEIFDQQAFFRCVGNVSDWHMRNLASLSDETGATLAGYPSHW